ncbi:hypothetical protein SAMN06295960_2139 [Paenibacillus aquistagni]|uniref:Uncharacterized protein n=1 Tax=Paenibacillus aquistagni TaxID=1852522 RepID=A0A1X7K6Z5_9BACL|nr:hypothetical protein SAMN06295960_2139 [Paenibacillus aquistagni]
MQNSVIGMDLYRPRALSQQGISGTLETGFYLNVVGYKVMFLKRMNFLGAYVLFERSGL